MVKIDKLYSKGFLSKAETDRLHAVRFLGNDSIHEIEVPTEDKLQSALVIIEHLLSNLYLIDKMIGNIETMIVTYAAFTDLINARRSSFQKGDQFPLRKILGKSMRRITSDNFKAFETLLQEKLKEGKHKILGLGEITKENINGKIVDSQNYIILNNTPYHPFDDWPELEE